MRQSSHLQKVFICSTHHNLYQISICTSFQTHIFNIMIHCLIVLVGCLLVSVSPCSDCYSPQRDSCAASQGPISDYMLHFSVHPHLDAFWIFDFQSYYEPLPTQFQVQNYFMSNRFSSVRQIFDTAYDVLSKSKSYRESGGQDSQKAHRSFFNSEMGFFKRWYSQQSEKVKHKVKQLLKTKYWQIVGGGYVEHDEGCAYYQDIIENYELGLHFLEKQLGYSPKIAVSADSFGHSQSTLAILAHIGVQGYFVERSDQHILLQNKTQFIWRAKSANGNYYGALPTHIRWAIHGFQDQFIESPSRDNLCQQKQRYIENMRKQNEFLKRILKSNHIMRYFGHDFQKFDDYSYSVMQAFMQKFSRESCGKVAAIYGNPSEYFKIMMGEVFNKVKNVVFRDEDIFPIWDYDSGLYWTGYFTTDPYHKKKYRDYGRVLSVARKAFLPTYMESTESEQIKKAYNALEQFAQIVAYLQHHDGISGTSKYEVLDKYQRRADSMVNNLQSLVFDPMFEAQFPLGSASPIVTCGLTQDCVIPQVGHSGDILIKLFNSGTKVRNQTFTVKLPEGVYYEPDCSYTTICMCYSQPCPCELYLTPSILTYHPIRLKKVSKPSNIHFLTDISQKNNDQMFSHNGTHIKIVTKKGKNIMIGYKTLLADPTPRHYSHLTRYGTQSERSFTIQSGKYALGNNPSTQKSMSTIRKISIVKTPSVCKVVVHWKRNEHKTVITYDERYSESWKIDTYGNAQGLRLQDLYLQIVTEIQNENKFYTDSNGWLTMQRTLFHHEDYGAHFSKQKYDDVDGNTYPMTAFAYIKDSKNKLSINSDRPQGVISPRKGILWVNYDRISSDDGKWVYQSTYRNQYQRFTHYLTFSDPSSNQQRIFQDLYDHPIIAQINLIQSNDRIQMYNIDLNQWQKWAKITGSEETKFWVRPWNDSTVTLRIQNNHDDKNSTITLFADKQSPYLTTYFGRNVQFGSIQQMSLGGNKKYEEFLKDKWNWNLVVNLSNENQIFSKEFGEQITLRPLEIRTFKISGLKFAKQCSSPSSLTYNNHKVSFRLNQSKTMPTRTDQQTRNQRQIRDFLHNGDHCNGDSPVLHTSTIGNSLDRSIVSPPSPAGKTVRRDQNQKSFAEKYPQKLPTDIKGDNFYQKLKQVYSKPINIKKTQPIHQFPSKPTKKPSQPREIQDKHPQPAIDESLEQPNVDVKDFWNEQIQNLKKKVVGWSPLTKAQKKQYFDNKLKEIEKVMKKGK